MGKVRGKVTYNGNALGKGSITFIPVQGKGGDTGQSASSPIESDGSYELTTFNTGDGAIAGQHTAIVRPAAEAPSVAPKPGGEISGQMPDFSGQMAPPPKKAGGLPDKYAAVDTSPLKFTVEANKVNEFDISLKD